MSSLYFMVDELEKLCASDVSYSDATEAMKRLRKLEKQTITPEEVTRGAIAGGAAGTLGQVARGLVSGAAPKGIYQGVKGKPGIKGKTLGLLGAVGKGIHSSGAAAAGSATFGASLPLLRKKVETEAEKAKLREYVGEKRHSGLRRTAKKYLGV